VSAFLDELPLPAWPTCVLAISSVVFFLGSLVLVPWLLVRLPQDYFLRTPATPSMARKVVRNVIGGLLVVLGLALLVLPGQGMLTVLLGLSVLDLPVKQRLLRRILCQRSVRTAVQKLRARAHRPPLLVPDRA
jgi:hypothetical protein